MAENIGARIRQRRRELNITQHSLAEKSGVSRMVICLLETGKRSDILVSTLILLADALDTTVDFFLT